MNPEVRCLLFTPTLKSRKWLRSDRNGVLCDSPHSSSSSPALGATLQKRGGKPGTGARKPPAYLPLEEAPPPPPPPRLSSLPLLPPPPAAPLLSPPLSSPAASCPPPAQLFSSLKGSGRFPAGVPDCRPCCCSGSAPEVLGGSQTLPFEVLASQWNQPG